MSQRHLLLTTDVIGGVWDFCMTLATEVVAGGATRVTLLAFGDPSPAQREASTQAGVTLLDAPLKLEWMRDAGPDVQTTRRLVAETARSIGAGVIHANQFAAACADVDVPVVLTLHSDVLSWRKWTLGDVSRPPEWQAYVGLVQEALHRADRTTAVSRFLADEVRTLYAVDETISVIHNAWPAPTHDPLPASERDGTLLAGRIWDEAKNVSVAAEAAQGWQPGKVLLAGDRVHPDGGQADVPRPLVPLGFLSRPELDTELDRAAVYLSAARYDPFGLLPLQAALHGCALLLSDIPSYREVWSDAALFFVVDDPKDLRRHWQRLLADDDLQGELRCRALLATKAYAPRRMAQAYEALYVEAAERIAA